MQPARSKLIAAFAAVYLIWGSTYLAIHYAIQTIPPFLMAGARFLVAGAVLYAWVASRAAKRPTWPQVRNASIVGLMLLMLGNGGVVWAEQTVPSGVTALIVAIVPLWLVVLSWARPGGTRPTVGVAAGVAVGLFGTVVLVGPDSLRGSGPINIWGAATLVLASLSWAAGSLFAKEADLPTPLVATSIEMLVAGTALMAAGLVSGEASRLTHTGVSLVSITGLAYLVVFGSVVGFTAYTWLLRNATPVAVGTYAYVNPVVAVALGWLIAGETVTGRTMAGAAIIVSAVIIVTISTNRNSSVRSRLAESV